MILKIVATIFFMVILFISPSFADILNVPSEQYTTIQAGINSAVAGDTVLVQLGTYRENINFYGKNIVVGSLFLTTGEDFYIPWTVIDGGDNDSVVKFENDEDSTTVLTGFTIQNGFVGGVYCDSASPSLTNVTIRNSFGGWAGGGIYCINSSPSLTNVTISNNSAYNGGGIYFYENSCPILKNVNIHNNIAEEAGGGIYCRSNTSISLSKVTLSHNYAKLGGGGIYCLSSNLIFDNQNRCNIYLNHAQQGRDIFSYLTGNINVIVDTFTVINPTAEHTYPIEKFTFDILNAKVTTSDDESDQRIPNKYALFQNYPNPSNPKTVISWQLPVGSEIDLSIYNLLGQKVATLVSERQPAGFYQVEWDASEFASGVYYYRLQCDNGFVQTKKLILLR